MVASPEISPESQPIGSPTILLVEDEVLIRLDVAEGLRAKGFRVLEAADAGEAICLLATGETIDLVFSDVQMPGDMDGVELARWVRRNRPGTPVMLGTGASGGFHAAIRRRWDGTLIGKAYDIEEVVLRIRGLLQI